ncbi:unnamed protein product [Nyctereutes procyonoides]|uniref:(raccoon dog) hypothetical protein n=1 Tax=Nyctereutes procyonoides TaxID=34880 RepID=A0A811YAZ3_NYCPR|nr:unnamed protein product [Nyctereutes procyonoides]
MVNKKPKEGVETDKNHHVNLKATKRHTPFSKPVKAYCEDRTHMHTWKWRMNTIDVFQQQTGSVY